MNFEFDFVDEMNGEIMMLEQFAENKCYNCEDLICDFIDKVIDIGFLVLVVFIIVRFFD